MSIVTRTGDAGMTVLMYNRRVSKSHPRVEAYGSVDELNAALGLARATATDPWIRKHLLTIQAHLVPLMGELATDAADFERYRRAGFPITGPEQTVTLDRLATTLEQRLPPSTGWATPGQSLSAAALELARTACRRAERRVCALHENEPLGNPGIIVYLNRLGDVLWLLARQAEGARPKRRRARGRR